MKLAQALSSIFVLRLKIIRELWHASEHAVETQFQRGRQLTPQRLHLPSSFGHLRYVVVVGLAGRIAGLAAILLRRPVDGPGRYDFADLVPTYVVA